MIALIQRVRYASVTITENLKSKIQKGMLVLLGVGENDQEEDAEYLTKKIVNLRIFADEQSKMNLDIKEVNGDILVVSQFTLYADTKKGNRPSFIKSAKPEKATHLYKYFIKKLEELLQKEVFTGEFGADMQVELCNDGPVTIILKTDDNF